MVDFIFQKIIDQLDLKNQQGKKLPIESLLARITVRGPKNLGSYNPVNKPFSGQLDITVRGTDPEEITKIASPFLSPFLLS